MITTFESYYDHPDHYDERFTKEMEDAYCEHYRQIFAHTEGVVNILDCSYGTGNLTFELAKLGYQVSGSDLSAKMLEKGRENARARGLDIDLTQCDFRELSRHFDRKFSCVMSTGNALGYVSNDDVIKTLHEMDRLVKEGGYIYIDCRNWDRELRNRKRIHPYRPYIRPDGTRINYMQVWDYHGDGSVTLNVIETDEENGIITDCRVYPEHYYPISKDLIVSTLERLGYGNFRLFNLPCWDEKDFDDMDWFCLLAKKF